MVIKIMWKLWNGAQLNTFVKILTHNLDADFII